MRGKEKCRALREIRQRIAEQNDIAFATEECKYKGECKGACPKCEGELKYLEQEIEKRRSLGKRVVLAGIAAGTALALGGCSIVDAVDALRAADTRKPGGTEFTDVTTGELPEYEMGDIDIGPIELMGEVPNTVRYGE